jgi:hypothetical protein
MRMHRRRGSSKRLRRGRSGNSERLRRRPGKSNWWLSW